MKLFSQARPNQVCGEITPGYAILNPEDIERIQVINPDIRLLLLIRDPIERAWSGLRHNVAKGKHIDWNSEMEMLSRLKKPDVALRGDYVTIVDNYLKFFDSSQLLVCFYDSIAHNPAGLLRSITSFLGIKQTPGKNADLKQRVNVSPTRDMPRIVREHLIEQYMPMITRASDRFGSYASSWKARYCDGGTPYTCATDGAQPPAVHP